MYQHIFIIGPALGEGKRIGKHFPIPNSEPYKFFEEIKEVQEFASQHSLDVVFHQVETNTSSRDSVIQMDPYFEKIEYIDSNEDFLEMLNDKHKIGAHDVAEYILATVGGCTNLKLQKLVYFAFEDYLLKTGKRLFLEPISAFQLGPVVRELYNTYKKYGKDPINPYDDSGYEQESDQYLELKNQNGNRSKVSSVRSKFLAVKSGVDMIESIENTIKKYGHKSASQLVTISHEEGSPWHITWYRNTVSDEITTEIILGSKLIN